MDNCRAAWGMCLQGDNCPLSIINCQLSIESPVLTSHFPDLPFSGNAHFRKIVPIRKTRVKYFKIHPLERIRMNTYLHNYTVSNTKKPSAAPVSTVESTYDWLRTDASAPPYRRVRTVVVVRPYENTHLSPFFRARRGTIPDVWNCAHPCEKTDERERTYRKMEQKEKKLTGIPSMCISRIAREGPSRSPIRILVQPRAFSGGSFDILTKWHDRFPIVNWQLTMDNYSVGGPFPHRRAIVNCQLSIVN